MSSSPTTRLDGRRDADVAERVTALLEQSPELDAVGIAVSVADGIVTLSGEAGSYSERLRARNLAMTVFGVRAVRDLTACRLDAAWSLGDDAIEAAARAAIAALAAEAAVEVRVEHRTVFLGGTVPSHAVRRAVHHAARATVGVHFVHDDLVVAAP